MATAAARAAEYLDESDVHLLQERRAMVSDAVLDTIIDALLECPDQGARAALTANLLTEVLSTIAWTHPFDPSAPELESLREVTAAAERHSRRMSATKAADVADDVAGERRRRRADAPRLSTASSRRG